jgi:hypothetical protein
LIAAVVTGSAASGELVLSETLEISKVPSEFPVGFSLLTTPDRQYAAYYDAERHMTVAARPLDSSAWTYQKLPSQVIWDSHNSVTMALDSAGDLHVSGNMHCVPLVYFRTAKPGDITSLTPAKMTGVLEDRVTYPRFFKDHEGRLIFTYRRGGSGNGINHQDYGAGSLSFDARTLDLIDQPASAGPQLPHALRKIANDFPGMEMRRANDSGTCGTPGVRYVMQWETLGPNRDRPRQPPIPAPSTLRLYKLTGAPDAESDPE